MSDILYIVEAEVDERNIIAWNHELEQEKSAVFDLTNNCYFKISKVKKALTK